MFVESRNPIGLSKVFSQNEKLKNLAEEITEGIFNLSYSDFKKAEIRSDVERIAELASNDSSPEIAVNTLLFRKYADVANYIKESRKHSFEKATDNTPPALSPTGSVGSDPNGWSKAEAKAFRLRVATFVFSLISSSVMASVDKINNSKWCPAVNGHFGGGGWQINASCPYSNMAGCFNFVPYQLVLSSGVIIFAYNTFMMVYQLLPTDINDNKYIPGLAHSLGQFIERDTLVAVNERFYAVPLWRWFTWKTATVFDYLVCVLGTISAILASIAVERSVQFSHSYYINNQFCSLYHYERVYYTIGSFYATFSNTSPICVQESADPGPKIRASLAMLYLAVFTIAVMVYNVSPSLSTQNTDVNGPFRNNSSHFAIGGNVDGNGDEENETEDTAVESRSLVKSQQLREQQEQQGQGHGDSQHSSGVDNEGVSEKV